MMVTIMVMQNYTPGWKFNHWEQKGVPIRIEVSSRIILIRSLHTTNTSIRLVQEIWLRSSVVLCAEITVPYSSFTIHASFMSLNQHYVFYTNLGEKIDLSRAAISSTIANLLTEIQAALFAKAKAGRDEKLVQVLKWEDFVPALNRNCLVLTPFCDQAEWESKVKVSVLYLYVLAGIRTLLTETYLQQMSREEALQGGTEAATTSTSVAAKTLCKPFEQPPLPAGTPCFVSGLPAVTWVLWGRSY